MSIAKALGRDKPVYSVNLVEYNYRTTQEKRQDNSIVTVHHVSVTINTNIFIGEYSADSEVNAFTLAQDVVKGILIRCGVKKPDTRINTIKFKKYGFPVIPLIDVTPNPVNWSNVTGTYDGTTNVQTITGISSSITLQITWSPPGAFNALLLNTQLFISISGEETELTTSGQTIVVNNNNTVAFLVYATGFESVSATVTVKNVTDSNTILDTFTVNVLPDNTPI